METGRIGDIKMQNGNAWSGSIRYTRGQLLRICNETPRALLKSVWLPAEVRRPYRGCRGGFKAKLQRRGNKPFVPSIIMGNVRSLTNKSDELSSLVTNDKDFCNSSLLCFTETWLNVDVPDANVEVPGFSLTRADRDLQRSGKKKGGGLVIFTNNKWCNSRHVTVRISHCCKDVELLAVAIRPYYLPREFSVAVVMLVYIPPSAEGETACNVIADAVAQLQDRYPSAFFVISGDFNHVNVSAVIPQFTQYVTCRTRGDRTLDLLYANCSNAYRSITLPPLGRSDHNLVLLRPTYRPVVLRQEVGIKYVRKWTHEGEEELRSCFETTNWELFYGAEETGIDEAVEVVKDYVNFCTDTVIPLKKIRCFPNNKPWVTKEVKGMLNKKKEAFKEGDQERIKAAQRELRATLKDGKDRYRRKLEEKLKQNDVREVWEGMRKITGYKIKRTGGEGTVEEANELNAFFNRFSEMAGPQKAQSANPEFNTQATPGEIQIREGEVKSQFAKLKVNKAVGPDNIMMRVLKSCASELSPVFTVLYNWSLRIQKVPKLWKTSCVVPVPKNSRPSGLNDFRPVALTCQTMKVFERLVLKQLLPLVDSYSDPLQFAYRSRLSVDDAVLYLLQRIHSRLDTGGSVVRAIFFDFSSAFNTICPKLLGEKMSAMNIDVRWIRWVLHYLMGRPQFVRLGKVVSDVVESWVGVPQGTVLAPFLFTLFTSDFVYNTDSCHLQKFSDDSVIVGSIESGDDTEYRNVVQRFVEWSGQNNLCLNVQKTKEMVISFGRRKDALHPLNIAGQEVQIVSTYKYLGVNIDDRLDWGPHVDAVCRKVNSRMYFLRRLRSFGVRGKMLETFYCSVVATVIYYAVVCWGSSVRQRDKQRIGKIIRRAASCMGVALESFQNVLEGRLLRKMDTILENQSHPLHNLLTGQLSTFSKRLRQVRCRSDRYLRSCIPAAIQLYNAALKP